MSLLFLCARHGRVNVAKARSAEDLAGPATAKGSKKIKRAAPQKAWIAQRAKECGLEHLLTVEEQSKADSSAPAGSSVQADNSALAGSSALVGSSAGMRLRKGGAARVCLAKVKPGQLAHGMLTPWDPEEQYLREFLYEDSWRSTLSLSVERCFPLAIYFRQPPQVQIRTVGA